MVSQTFVAFSSADPLVADLVSNSCESATTPEREFLPWNRYDVSGQPIDDRVRKWVGTASSLIADVSEPNHNVTFEIGLSLGLGNQVRLIRTSIKSRKLLEEIGLLHNIGHDDYRSRVDLINILQRPFTTAAWPKPVRNRDAPLYVMWATSLDPLVRRTLSGVKKTMKMRFRNFNPREIDRLTATEAYDSVAQSFGLICFWHNQDNADSFRQNQRAAFAVGVASGLEIPFLLFAEGQARLPLDLDEVATRYQSVSDVDAKLRAFREVVAELQADHVELKKSGNRFLDSIHCGDPTAENEATHLSEYFVETEQYKRTLQGDLNIILGRKGSGKSAIFIQVRDRIRANKNNIVVDLAPEGFQLIKLKELVLRNLSLGARKELIAAFWEYIIWLEIAYKILEKDEKRAKNDSKLSSMYSDLSEAYRSRVEGFGDFAERLNSLTDRVVGRFDMEANNTANEKISSTRTLHVVYGSEIKSIRQKIIDYLKTKGIVLFLFDNLDRFWTPVGFGDVDSLLIVGLVECLQDIKRRFAKIDITYQWAIFLRSDVYEFVVKNMADYSKLASSSVEWGDRELLIRLFQDRVLQGFGSAAPAWSLAWERITVPKVKDQDTLEFLIDSSLMRPRYLIRLFETARRRAVTLGRDRIEEGDYEVALTELGWQVLEDFDHELSDVMPNAEALLYDLSQLGKSTSVSALRTMILEKINDTASVEAVIDVLIWSGCVGVRNKGRVWFISDCGFKRQFFRGLLANARGNCVVFHPTLASIFDTPGLALSGSERGGATRYVDNRQGTLPGLNPD